MKKIKTIFRNLYFKFVVSTSEKLTRKLARNLFLNYLKERKYRYIMSDDKFLIESGFQLSEHERVNVFYDFDPMAIRIVCQAHFLQIELRQIPEISLLIAHLNNFMGSGQLKINFKYLRVYYELDANASSILLNPEHLSVFHSSLLYTPSELMWCFKQVLEENEDPVVVVGSYIQRLRTDQPCEN